MEENSKLKTVSNSKENKQPYLQKDSQSKRMSKTQTICKNDISQTLPSQYSSTTSPMKKVLFETNKIVKIGLASEFALLEKDTTIQSSNETIDNLRKNILHLQMEYEKLDQNYQREFSQRADIIKRMEVTQNMVDSTVNCSNALSTSIKQLEEDKNQLADCYELIYQRQTEVAEKHSNIEKFVNELDNLLKAKFNEVRNFQESITLQNAQEIADLNQKLNRTINELNIKLEENENLLKEIANFRMKIKSLDSSLERKGKVIYNQQKKIVQFKMFIRDFKIKKTKIQNLLKRKNKEIFSLRFKNNEAIKKLFNLEKLQGELLIVKEDLEEKNFEFKSKIDEQSQLYLTEQKQWETNKEELIKQTTAKELEIDRLNTDIRDFKRKIEELLKNTEKEKQNWSQLKKNYDQVLQENENIKSNFDLLNEENNRKTQMILDFESKLSIYDKDLNSDLLFYKKELEKRETFVKTLEQQLQEAQEKICKAELLLSNSRDEISAEYEYRIKENEITNNQKIDQLEKDLRDKLCIIQNLTAAVEQKSECNKNLKKEIENLKFAELEKNKALEKQQEDYFAMEQKNIELNSILLDFRKNKEILENELEKTKKQKLDLNEKLTTEYSSIKVLKADKLHLEKIVATLKKENEQENKRILDENSKLKLSVADLESRLEGAEARVEAYKVVVKKLESEKVECKDNHSQEVLKLKLELKSLQDNLGKDEEFAKVLELSQGSYHEKTNKRESSITDSGNAKTRKGECLSHETSAFKENDASGIYQDSATPSSKKFLSTPRKVLTSTPQLRANTQTSVRKKRDPYDFDSDSSVERFNPDQVMKIFGTKKEIYKKPRIKKNL